MLADFPQRQELEDRRREEKAALNLQCEDGPQSLLDTDRECRAEAWNKGLDIPPMFSVRAY